MMAADHDRDEEQFIARLIEYDEAVNGPAVEPDASSTHHGRSAATSPWYRAQQCLALLGSLFRKGNDDSEAGGAENQDAMPSPAAKCLLTRGRDFGRFRILEVLGEGGMGTVYKALHTKLDRLVALKVLAPRWSADADVLARFYREMKLVAALDHRHLVRALDADELDGVHFLVMEYIPGTDLALLPTRLGPLAVPDACEVIRQAALGLEEVHRGGLIHRDVKPSNLVLGQDGYVRILDLGLALLRSHEAAELTKPGQTLGTADYMAPEQLLDPRSVDKQTDIYGLGCTLYYLLCNRAPFGGEEFDTAGKKMLAHATLPVPRLRSLRGDVPPELESILDHMLAKEMEHRIASSTEVVAAMGGFTRGADLRDLIDRYAIVGIWPCDAIAPKTGSRPD